MKERTLYEDEFEKQLKEKSDQYKMYPSDKVWNEVYSSLHSRRKRFIAGMAFLIGGFLILAGTQLISPSKITNLKPVTAKLTGEAKSNAANGYSGFPVNSLLPISKNNSAEVPVSGTLLKPVIPYIYSGEADLASDGLKSVPEKVRSTESEKTFLTDPQPISASSPLALIVPAQKENTLQETANHELINAATDLTAEKSVTRLTHSNDRFSWEIYIAPSMNTHYLTGIDYQAMRQSLPNTPIMVVNIANVNGFVDNTPLVGYNVGGNIMYRLSKNISLKAGLEFSYNRYYIRAYNNNPTQSAATLNSYLGYVADSLLNYNVGNGVNGNKNPQHFQNRYFQLSMPVGLEMKVAGNGKFQVHMGVNLQPSYLLNTDSYVLSSDYNSYTRDPQAFRRWNLNAGGEVFLSYGTGPVRWELGPQIRYQIFSSYKNAYPFKENLLNYGIRIGISKTIR